MSPTANEHRNALPTGYRLAEFRILSILGHGGFGITYRARDEDLHQDDEAHARFCPAPVAVAQPRAMIAQTEPYGPPDMGLLRTDLTILNPDSSEEGWKLCRIAPLARTARDHPELAEDLRALAMEYSSGVLRDEPSRKWREPGRNGLTGEQEFDRT